MIQRPRAIETSFASRAGRGSAWSSLLRSAMLFLTSSARELNKLKTVPEHSGLLARAHKKSSTSITKVRDCSSPTALTRQLDSDQNDPAMTREDSIRTQTWVTNDGRYLSVDEITDDHLCNIRRMLIADMTPGYDQTAGRQIAQDSKSLLNYSSVAIDGSWTELDRDMYASAWLQIIDTALEQREAATP